MTKDEALIEIHQWQKKLSEVPFASTEFFKIHQTIGAYRDIYIHTNEEDNEKYYSPTLKQTKTKKQWVEFFQSDRHFSPHEAIRSFNDCIRFGGLLEVKQ